MITYKTTLNSISQFKAWGGAIDTLNTLKELGNIKAVDDLINELYDCPSEQELNDFLWFYLEDYAPELLEEEDD